MTTTAQLTSNWPRPPPLVDVQNWVDDVYLKRCGVNASIGSRFAKSEPYARHVVFSLLPWPRSSPVKQPSIPNIPSFAPASWSHQELKLLHQLRIIHPADRPRFAEPGLLCFPMIHDLVQPPSATLRGSAATIPSLDFDLPFVLFYSHHPYHSPTSPRGWNGYGTKHELFLTAHGFVLHKDPNTCVSILGATFLRGSGAAVGKNHKEGNELLYLALKEFHLIHPSFTKLEALDNVCGKENLEIANNDFDMGWKPGLDLIFITQSPSSSTTVTKAAVKVQYPGVADSIESDLSNLSMLINASGLATRTMTTMTPTMTLKLDDVNNTGTARSKDCTLIITEGNLRTGRCVLASAKACFKYMIMYEQVGSINQEVIKAYFTITSINRCWVFLDGI